MATDSTTTTSERPSLKEIANGFEARILANVDYFETERRLPQDLVDDLYDSGIFRAFLPKEFGGLEAHPLEWLEAVEELARINGSVGWVAMLHSGVTWAAPEELSEIVKNERWLTAGNFNRAGGKAVQTDGGYIVTGRWSFCSGSPEANYLYGRCVMHDKNGEVVLSPIDGQPWYVTPYFPRSETTLHDTWNGLGLRGTGSGDIEVNEVFVPRSMVNERGVHFRQYDLPVYRGPFSGMAHAFHSLGVAKAMREEYVKQFSRKATPGSFRQQKFGRQQMDQWALGRADALIQSTRDYVWRVISDAYENAQVEGPISYEHRVRLHQANIHAVHTSREAVELLFKHAGSPAVVKGIRMEQVYRDMMVGAQSLQVSENSLDLVGQFLLTKDRPSGPEIDTAGNAYIQGPHPQDEGKVLPEPVFA